MRSGIGSWPSDSPAALKASMLQFTAQAPRFPVLVTRARYQTRLRPDSQNILAASRAKWNRVKYPTHSASEGVRSNEAVTVNLAPVR
jgi:hypothetical protein